MKVKNLINSNGNPARNQFVITDDSGNIFFQSYETPIARYDKNSRKLYITHSWDYSNTTRKHFYIFLDKYTSITPKKDAVLKGIASGDIKVVDESEISY